MNKAVSSNDSIEIRGLYYAYKKYNSHKTQKVVLGNPGDSFEKQ